MAYAAVTSLKYTIDRLHIQLTTSENRALDFLRSTLERLDDRRDTNIDRSAINALEEKISEAALKFEDALEFFALNHSGSRSDILGQICPRIAEYDSARLEQESKSFFSTLDELVEDYIRVLDNPMPRDEEDEDFCGDETEAVGLSDQVEKLTKLLVDFHRGSKTTIVDGMAGIGKTRLAREIYHHPIIKQHFKFTVWVRIGQHPDANRVLKAINNTGFVAQEERCLIVLDDVWSFKVIECLEASLPGEGQRRFLVTTRVGGQPISPQPESGVFRKITFHTMPFLDEEQSWSLLQQIVFPRDETISSQLEEVGRRIADNCEGLPLLILTVANILRVQDISEEYWKKVADKKTTTFPDAFEQIYDILILSYDYLPQHLKSCFLYMGVFCQSFVIPSTKLQILMAVEAFSKRRTYPPLEWLDKLVGNSIVIVCEQSFLTLSSIKSCKLHFVYWYLCVKEARKVNFFHAFNKLADVTSIETRPRRLSFQNNVLPCVEEVYDSMAANAPSTTRSLLCTGIYHQHPVEICFNMILLKVLDALAVRFYEFPNEILNLVELRYLALTHHGIIPPSISTLQKMQYLILRQHHNIRLVRHSAYMPEEIWDMKELKDLQMTGFNLPDPPNVLAVLHNLTTLHVNAGSCTEAVFKGVSRRLRRLRITIELEPDSDETTSSCFEHVGHLLKLKSLTCVVVNPRLISHQVIAPPNHLSNFPERLVKLSLNGLGYSWKDIGVIGLLPDLNVLKLRCYAFQGPEWESRPEEFQSLRILVLEDIDLVHWTLKDGSQETFPCIWRLVLGHCYKLKEIPVIQNLKSLEVLDCSPSLAASAEQRTRFLHEVKTTSSWDFR